jgi:hypothetical protein
VCRSYPPNRSVCQHLSSGLNFVTVSGDDATSPVVARHKVMMLVYWSLVCSFNVPWWKVQRYKVLWLSSLENNYCSLIKSSGGFCFEHVNAGSRDSVVGIATGYGLDNQEVGVRVQVGSRILCTSARPALGSTQPPIQWVSSSGLCVNLTIHLQLVPRSEKCGSIHPLLHTPSCECWIWLMSICSLALAGTRHEESALQVMEEETA